MKRLCAECRRIVDFGPCPHCYSGWANGRRGKSWHGTRANTGDKRWRRLREEHFQNEPYCVRCGAIATDLDHLPGADFNDSSGHGKSWLSPDMVQGLCRACHRYKTAKESRA